MSVAVLEAICWLENVFEMLVLIMQIIDKVRDCSARMQIT